MKTEQVEAKDIKIGDRVLGVDGKPVTINDIGKGMPRNTLELRWSKGGWQAFSPTTLVERVL